MKDFANLCGPVIDKTVSPYSYFSTNSTISSTLFFRIGCEASAQKKAELTPQKSASTVLTKVSFGRRTSNSDFTVQDPLSIQHPPFLNTIKYLQRSALNALGIILSQAFNTLGQKFSLINSLLSVALQNSQENVGLKCKISSTVFKASEGTQSFSLVWQIREGIRCLPFCYRIILLFVTFTSGLTTPQLKLLYNVIQKAHWLLFSQRKQYIERARITRRSIEYILNILYYNDNFVIYVKSQTQLYDIMF